MRCAFCRGPHWRTFRRKRRPLHLCRLCASWLMCELQTAGVNPGDWLRLTMKETKIGDIP